jgi:hypothetical protein
MKPGPEAETPTGLIVLASGQVMPNIKSLLWAIKKANLRALAIVASGVDESQKAGDRLTRLVAKINAGKIADFRTKEPIAVEVFVEKDIDRFPEKLSPRLTGFIEKQCKRVPHWMVNFTAGSKIMFLSLVSHFRTSVQEWHYLEGARSGRWSRYRIDQNFAITTEELEIPDYTDDLPLDELVYLISGKSVKLSPLPDLPGVTQLTDSLLSAKWHMRKGFADAGAKISANTDPSQKGFLFEAYVARCVRALGIKNVALNLEIVGSKGMPVNEIDIVCVYQGTIHLLDIKSGPKSGSPKGEHLRALHTSARLLGGNSGKAALVWPAINLSEEWIDWAQTLKIDYMGPNHKSRIFSFLAKFLGCKNAYGSLDEKLEKAHRSGNPMSAGG